MDTREKIVDARAAAQIKAGGATVVSGYFDPLIAWHARWLANFKKPGKALMVLIATPENVILPVRARQELIASLAVVDHVAEFSDELAAGAVRLETQDRELFHDLLQLVHARSESVAAAKPN
jgi:bifunctional ADP-heptose synthase (sugar kinase/adenylyltransferase)